MQNFGEHLGRQLRFLQRSCAAFDAGHHDEAIRIATVLRIQFHDTPRQVSLLSRLATSPVRLLDTAGTPEDTRGILLFNGVGTYMLGGDGKTQYMPGLGDVPFVRYLPFPKWWAQEIFINGDVRVTRRSVALTAADRDGGAHVDARLTPDYEALMSAGAAGWFVAKVDGQEPVTPTTDVHFLCLRQLGYEVTNSPELARLKSPVRP